jgi:hypothetical protein
MRRVEGREGNEGRDENEGWRKEEGGWRMEHGTHARKTTDFTNGHNRRESSGGDLLNPVKNFEFVNRSQRNTSSVELDIVLRPSSLSICPMNLPHMPQQDSLP